jgi:hypothetical protein
LGATVSASAQSTLLSTLNSTTASGSQWIGYDQVVQKFTTGSQSENIGSISVAIGSESDPGSDFTISIYSNSSGQPGSVVSNGLLSGAAVPTVNSVNEYDASGLTLAANTTYFLFFNNTIGQNVLVQTAQALSTSSTAGWTLGDPEYRYNGHLIWNDIGQVGVPLFSINAAPVPEPTTLALAGLSGLGLLLFRRRK